MQKTEALPIRVDPETKRMAAAKAEMLGISVAAYIRMLIRLDNQRDTADTRLRRE
jgi:antitoxin component of RelBE/YafQ-DinJ toxin-antitoxin module